MLVFFVILVILVLFFLFPFIQVCGDSMTPTYKDNEVILSTRLFNRKNLKIGDVVVTKFKYKDETEGHQIVIKRVADVYGGKVYLLGDNPTVSYDSRDYGYVPLDYVICRIIKPRKKVS